MRSLRSTARTVRAGTLVISTTLIVALLHCGGGNVQGANINPAPPPPPTYGSPPGPNWGPPPSPTPSPGPRGQDTGLEALLDGLQVNPAPAPAPRPPRRPDPPPAPTPGPTPPVTGDPFTDGMAEIRGKVPRWDNGAGIAIKFLQESSGKRTTLLYVDETPPEQKSNGLWLVHATSKSSGQVVGHFVILLRSLQAGHYDGNPHKNDVVLAASVGEEKWDAKGPDTTWSINEGAWCEIVLRQGRGPGDLEGDFRGKLVSNSGKVHHNVESGYVYIKRY